MIGCGHHSTGVFFGPFGFIGAFLDLFANLFGRLAREMENDEWERTSQRHRRASGRARLR
jgi:hypothetical protein